MMVLCVAGNAHARGPAKTTERSVTAVVGSIDKALDALDYEGAMKQARGLLTRSGLDAQLVERLRYIVASSAAILGDPDAAEQSFLEILDNNPSFELPDEAEPKVIIPFRSAKAVFARRYASRRDAERARLSADVQLTLEHQEATQGGLPAKFEFRLQDPGGHVNRIDLNYRRQGDGAYASLPLERTTDATWLGQLGGDWTQSTQDYVLEIYAQTFTADGLALSSAGDAANPLMTAVQRGEVERPRPFYKSPWFWVAAGAGVMAAGIATYVIVDNASSVPRTDLGTVTF